MAISYSSWKKGVDTLQSSSFDYSVCIKCPQTVGEKDKQQQRRRESSDFMSSPEVVNWPTASDRWHTVLQVLRAIYTRV